MKLIQQLADYFVKQGKLSEAEINYLVENGLYTRLEKIDRYEIASYNSGEYYIFCYCGSEYYYLRPDGKLHLPRVDCINYCGKIDYSFTTEKEAKNFLEKSHPTLAKCVGCS